MICLGAAPHGAPPHPVLHGSAQHGPAGPGAARAAVALHSFRTVLHGITWHFVAHFCMTLYGLAWHRMALHGTTRHCTAWCAPRRTAQRAVAPPCTAAHGSARHFAPGFCTALLRFARHSGALHGISRRVPKHCRALRGTAPRCTASHHFARPRTAARGVTSSLAQLCTAARGIACLCTALHGVARLYTPPPGAPPRRGTPQSWGGPGGTSRPGALAPQHEQSPH